MRKMPPPLALDEAQKHPRWDKQSKRIILTSKEISALPVVPVSGDELFNLMQNWDFNPWSTYPVDVLLLSREEGHDSHARYIGEGLG